MRSSAWGAAGDVRSWQVVPRVEIAYQRAVPKSMVRDRSGIERTSTPVCMVLGEVVTFQSESFRVDTWAAEGYIKGGYV
nr:hypothetical protein CFP56_79350 [Quercus suber]